MKNTNQLFLEQLVSEARQNGISFNSKRRIYISQDRDYFLKFHPLESLERISQALLLQEVAHQNGFPCSPPVKSKYGACIQDYDDGFVTADRCAPGERLDERMLWCDEVSSFIKLFFEFQKEYAGPKITYQRKGIGELITMCNKEIYFPQEYLEPIHILSQLDSEFCEGDSIIHGDILPKNIMRTPNNNLVLIDFEKVMRGTREGEVASSIFYSHMGTGIDLKDVYDAILSSLQGKVPIDKPKLKAAITHKVAEYLLHKNINHNLGQTKRKEIKKAERFFSGALKKFGASS